MKLSSDYLSVESNVYTFTADYEAPALVKSNGVYFMFASQLTGMSLSWLEFFNTQSLTNDGKKDGTRMCAVGLLGLYLLPLLITRAVG
jgi:hypothetical protein